MPTMVTLSVLYPKTPSSHFDHDYYLNTHTPLVKARFTPEGIDLFQSISAPDGGPAPYELIALIHFSSVDHLQTALATHGPEVLGDIPRFTNVEPLVQINRPVAR